LQIFAISMDGRGLSRVMMVVIAMTEAVLRTEGQPESRAVDGASHSSRGCVYSFQVWTPNQDVLAKLRRLEERCDAVRSSVDREVRRTTSHFTTVVSALLVHTTTNGEDKVLLTRVT